jgi:hypothetical protein
MGMLTELGEGGSVVMHDRHIAWPIGQAMCV